MTQLSAWAPDPAWRQDFIAVIPSRLSWGTATTAAAEWNVLHWATAQVSKPHILRREKHQVIVRITADLSQQPSSARSHASGASALRSRHRTRNRLLWRGFLRPFRFTSWMVRNTKHLPWSSPAVRNCWQLAAYLRCRPRGRPGGAFLPQVCSIDGDKKRQRPTPWWMEHGVPQS